MLLLNLFRKLFNILIVFKKILIIICYKTVPLCDKTVKKKGYCGVLKIYILVGVFKKLKAINTLRIFFIIYWGTGSKFEGE